jgi:hypothetical protein
VTFADVQSVSYCIEADDATGGDPSEG